MLRYALIGLVAVAAGGAGLVAGQKWRLPPAQPTPPGLEVARIGDRLPDLRLPDLAGQTQPIADARGRPLLINYWATWCAPCVEEMPLLDAFARAQGEHGTQVLGIALDDAESVRRFLKQVPVDYRLLIEDPSPRDSSVALGNNRGVLPYTVLVDADGRIRKAKLGAFTKAELARWVD